VLVTSDDATGRVHVTWLRDAELDETTLRRLVGELAGRADRLTVVHACRTCGSDRHGKTRVVMPPGEAPVFVSLARSRGRAVVAVTAAGEIGVDIEAMVPDGPDDLVEWVRTESLVKASGHGLTIDPSTLDMPRRTVDLEAPDGFVAAVTVLTRRPLDVTTTR
jgi:4'-phosphopantetheinyl transferase